MAKKKELATSWQQRLAKHSKTNKAPVEKPLTGDFISAVDGKFKMGKTVLGTELECVVVDWRYENQYHNYRWVKGTPFPPTCFSIGVDEDNMFAHETSPEMQGGADHGCVDCELNEWGSGVGDSKACSNRRRLALVVNAERGKPEIKILSIPPTSLASWKLFITEVDDRELHSMQVAVRISFDEESTNQKMPLKFEIVEIIEDESMLNELAGVLDKAAKLLDTPSDVKGYKGGNTDSKPSTKEEAAPKAAPKKTPKAAPKKTSSKKGVVKKKGRSKFSKE